MFRRRIKDDSGLLGSAKISLLTITTEEFPIVQNVFALSQNLPDSPYFVEDATRRQHNVVLRRAPAQTNLISAESTGEVVQDFRPEVILLIGTAGGYGGRDGLAVGDVVIADYVEFSGYWKYKPDQILRRKFPHDHPSLYLRDHFAEPLRVTPDVWRSSIVAPRPVPGQPSLFIGEIVSGDVLLGNPNNTEQQRILDFFDKALGFEMEAVGVARAVHKARRWVTYNPQFAVIRGISDLVNTNAAENQATRVAWTNYAVSAAASVAKVLVDRVLAAMIARERAELGFFGRLAERLQEW